jgi:hypothetical protein
MIDRPAEAPSDQEERAQLARIEDRIDVYAIRVFEYAPEHLPWGGRTEAGVGFAGE